MFAGLTTPSPEVLEDVEKLAMIERAHWSEDTPVADLVAMAEPAGYSFVASGFAVASGAAKTAALLRAGATSLATITELALSTDAQSGNVVVDLVLLDGTIVGASAANPNPVQIRGIAVPAGATVGAKYTTEPGVKTIIKTWRFPCPGGPFVIQYPLGREPEHLVMSGASGVGKQISIQVTGYGYSGTANMDCTIEFEE